jgi:uncharacterized protein (DUF1330 family)
MPAYILACIDVTDPVAYEEYRQRAPAAIAAYGGRYLARGGLTECLEGRLPANRLVILEFPDMERVRAFYASPEYQPLVAIRQSASTGSLIALQGL